MKSGTFRSLFKKRAPSSDTTTQHDKPSDLSVWPATYSDVNGLGQDILILIFDLIQLNSPKTLQALSLVNWTFYHLTSHARLRDLRLDIGPAKLQASHDRLKHAERKQLLSAISTLEVLDFGSRPYDSSGNHDPFAPNSVNYRNVQQYIANLMPLMTGLKIIRWKDSGIDHCVPDCVLEALRSCPRVKLHAKAGGVPRIRNGTGVDSNLRKLQGNASLSLLKVHHTYYGAEDCLKITQPLKQLLLSTPALRLLTLDIHQPTGGCCVYSPPTQYCGLGFVDGESMPALEELMLLRYPWGSESKPTDTQTWSNSHGQTGYPGKGDEIDHWADNFDWSSLKRLQTSCVRFALKAMPKLTALREVSFTCKGPQNDIIHFYQECPTALEAIGVETLQGITLEGILRHGSNLRILRIHTNESSTWAETAMDDTSLCAIRDSCPHIEELFLDIPRSGGDWPWSTLDILTSFRNLQDLTICFELGLDHDSDPVKPYVTFSSVRTLFTYLLNPPASAPPRKLKRLHVMSGSPPPLGYGYPSPQAYWPRRNSTEFICTLSERDDEAARRVFEVICPAIAGKDQQTSKGGRRRRARGVDTVSDAFGEVRRQAQSEATRLANEGPISRRKWKENY